jgi:hypothetical protein
MLRYLSLVDHERTGHPTAYLCILCGLACHSADSLISHGDRQHPRITTYLCRYGTCITIFKKKIVRLTKEAPF